MTITALEPAHLPGLTALFDKLPDGDLTFIKEDVGPEAVATWQDAPGWRWVMAGDDGSVVGFAALLPLAGWSDHVAELRLVVDPDSRGQGVGHALAQHAVKESVRADLAKVVVELPAAQERTIDMFLGLGFTGEALLRDHFRDRSGQVQDLIMLAHFAEQAFATMNLVGVADALEGN